MNTSYIEARILNLCIQPRTFDFICKNLDGLDPTRLHVVLQSLTQRKALEQKNDLWLITPNVSNTSFSIFAPEPHSYLRKYMGYFDFLKTPHPLDFEWRNSTASLNYLCSLIQDICPAYGTVLLLGMPTLFATAFELNLPQKVTLVEKNKPITRALQSLTKNSKTFLVREADIFTTNPVDFERFDLVLMDPPWYSAYFYQFMWLAARCAKISGTVGISLPPLNTKDDIILERIEWLNFCQKQGLCVESIFTQKLSYTMPFFEFNAFRVSSLNNLHPFWRKGDLALFKKMVLWNPRRPSPVRFITKAHRWVEKETEGVRIRVGVHDIDSDAPVKINHLLKGDILPSVSKGEKQRRKANVWTSGNRIFRTNNPPALIRALDSLILNHSPKNQAEDEAGQFLRHVAELEKQEHNDYLEWLYHEMERPIQ